MKDLAFTKLTITEAGHQDPRADEVLKAALVCRLALGIEHTVIGSSFAARLVAKRMAVALFIAQSRSFMAASYPVDPVLAWAAFQVIQLHTPERVCDALSELTESGMIERGPRGQLVTKLALMRAYDRTLAKQHSVENPKTYSAVSQIPHFSAVSLGDLLSALNGSNTILDVLDTNCEIPLRDLTNCDLVLAQWIGCRGNEDTVDTELAVHALFTHCGLQMPLNMSGIDHMLVACRDAAAPISKSNMVVIMLQSKNRRQPRSEALPWIVERFSTQGVPVIYILHEVVPRHLTPYMQSKQVCLLITRVDLNTVSD